MSDKKYVDLLTSAVDFPGFMDKIKDCYTVVNISLSEISPNLILDAIRYNKPFICTREVGIYERIKSIGLYVNPLDENEIRDAIEYLLVEENYEKEREKIQQFNFTHTWEDMGREFIETFNTLQK